LFHPFVAFRLESRARHEVSSVRLPAPANDAGLRTIRVKRVIREDGAPNLFASRRAIITIL